MPESEARAWWADVQHVREAIERRRAAAHVDRLDTTTRIRAVAGAGASGAAPADQSPRDPAAPTTGTHLRLVDDGPDASIPRRRFARGGDRRHGDTGRDSAPLADLDLDLDVLADAPPRRRFQRSAADTIVPAAGPADAAARPAGTRHDAALAAGTRREAAPTTQVPQHDRRAHRSTVPEPASHLRSVAAPASAPAAPRRRTESASSAPLDPPRRRRTVEITGRAVPAPSRRRLVEVERRRPARRPVERFGARPDRLALWAVALGFFLILVAATSSSQAATRTVERTPELHAADHDGHKLQDRGPFVATHAANGRRGSERIAIRPARRTVRTTQ